MILMGILSGLGGIVFIFLLYEIFRCKHQWEFVDKTEFAPPIEAAKKNGVSTTWDLTSWQIQSMSKKTVVIVIRCPKCGTPKVLRESH
jgi:hypothetical protein